MVVIKLDNPLVQGEGCVNVVFFHDSVCDRPAVASVVCSHSLRILSIDKSVTD